MKGFGGGEDFEFVFKALLHYDKFCFLNDFYYVHCQSKDSLVNFDKGDLKESDIVRKIVRHKLHEVRTFKLMRGNIRKSRNIKQGKLCMRCLNYRIGQKYYSVANNLKCSSRLNALRYCIVSLAYGYDSLKMKQIALLIMTGHKEDKVASPSAK